MSFWPLQVFSTFFSFLYLHLSSIFFLTLLSILQFHIFFLFFPICIYMYIYTDIILQPWVIAGKNNKKKGAICIVLSIQERLEKYIYNLIKWISRSLTIECIGFKRAMNVMNTKHYIDVYRNSNTNLYTCPGLPGVKKSQQKNKSKMTWTASPKTLPPHVSFLSIISHS